RRGTERAQLRVELDALAMLALAAQSGRVDEDDRPISALEDRVDCVARRSRDVRHDHALTADDRVQQRRLADVRPTEDRDADRVPADPWPPLPRRPLYHRS